MPLKGKAIQGAEPIFVPLSQAILISVFSCFCPPEILNSSYSFNYPVNGRLLQQSPLVIKLKQFIITTINVLARLGDAFQ